MTEFKCPRCDYLCYDKKVMTRHIERKNKCKPIIADVEVTMDNVLKKSVSFSCEGCKKTYTTPSSLSKHRETCKSLKTEEEVLRPRADSSDSSDSEEVLRPRADSSDSEEVPRATPQASSLRVRNPPTVTTNNNTRNVNSRSGFSLNKPGSTSSMTTVMTENGIENTINNTRNINNLIFFYIEEKYNSYVGNDECNKFVSTVSDKNYHDYGMTQNIFSMLLNKEKKWILWDYFNDVLYEEIPIIETDTTLFENLEEKLKTPEGKEDFNRKVQEYVQRQLKNQQPQQSQQPQTTQTQGRSQGRSQTTRTQGRSQGRSQNLPLYPTDD